jgi:hypothetical protein
VGRNDGSARVAQHRRYILFTNIAPNVGTKIASGPHNDIFQSQSAKMICVVEILRGSYPVLWFCEFNVGWNIAKDSPVACINFWVFFYFYLCSLVAFISLCFFALFSFMFLFPPSHVSYRHYGVTVVKVLYYKSESRWFDSRLCQWTFHWHKILPIALWPWGRLRL